MRNDTHLAIVRDLYAAFLSGDVDGILKDLSEEIDFLMPDLPGVPLKPLYHGKAGVVDFLKDREPLLRYTAFEPRSFFSDQSTVIVLGSTAGMVLSNETPFGYKRVQLFEFDEQDRIARFHEFFDTHVLVSAVRQ